jgi:hypothetical protein
MFLVLRSRLCCRLLKNGREGWFVAAEHQVMNEIVIDKVKRKEKKILSLFFSLLGRIVGVDQFRYLL